VQPELADSSYSEIGVVLLAAHRSVVLPWFVARGTRNVRLPGADFYLGTTQASAKPRFRS